MKRYKKRGSKRYLSIKGLWKLKIKLSKNENKRQMNIISKELKD
jgi:hypothetical protein